MALVDCREATQLTSAALDRPLTLRERVRLSVHRLLCAPCRLYRRQLDLLRSQAGKLDASAPDMRLNQHARERIRTHLRGAIDNEPGTDTERPD